MASKNPFGGLNIAHDDDEDNVQTVSSSQPLFQAPQDAKKKKKIRPEEKNKLEEEQNQQTFQPQTEEGFSEVRKRAPRSNKYDEEGEGAQRKNEQGFFKNKGAYNPRNNQRGRGGKRPFDRHSGTGRGREVSKQGAGSGTTWGNEEQLANREATGQTETYEEEYNYNDDKYFNFAAQDALKQSTPVEEKKTEEVPAQTQPATNQETTPQEETAPQENQEGRNRKDRKKRRKGEENVEEEEKKEAKPEVPDNSMSYKEYKEMKSKNANQTQTNNVVRKEDPNLKPTSKQSVDDDLNIFGTVSKKQKTKEKRANASEASKAQLEAKLNQILSSNVIEGKTTQTTSTPTTTTTTTTQQNNQENRQGQSYRGNQGQGRGGYGRGGYKKSQQTSGFTFSNDAFPEL